LLQRIGNFILRSLRKVINLKNFNEFKELNPTYLKAKIHSNLDNKHSQPRTTFKRIEPTLNQPLKNTASLSATENAATSALAQTAGPAIILPRNSVTEIAENTAKEAHKKQTVNPTFEFINETRESPKKTAHKISPEDIYRTEGMKSQNAPKDKAQSQQTAVQTELLDMPDTTAIKQLVPIKQQQPANDTALKPEKAKITPPENQIYTLPSLDLLTKPKETGAIVVDETALKENAAKLEQVLNDFGIRGQIVEVRPGPVVTLYELEPKAGTRTARVIGLSDDIARSMAVP
jgi:DNA segregation ATPase FtsK/SpoIIIE-like protein